MSLDFYLKYEVEPDKFIEAYHRNITSNVNPMWSKANCYDALFNSNGIKAKYIEDILVEAVINISTNVEQYELLEPVNKWGTVANAIDFLNATIDAIEEYPNSVIKVWK